MTRHFENIATYVTGFTAASLVISVAYDYGFLRYLGLSFRELPTTLADHVRTTLVWMPSLVIAALFIFAFEQVTRRIEGGLSEEELIARSPIPRFTKWFRDSPVYFFLAFAFFVPIAYLFFDTTFPPGMWVVSAPTVWIALHLWVFRNSRVRERVSDEAFLLSRWAPAVLIFFAFQGALAAEDSYKPAQAAHVLLTTSGPQKVTIIRAFEEFYLVATEPDDRLRIIAKPSVLSFERLDGTGI